MTAEPRVSVDDIALHLGRAKDPASRWIARQRLPARAIGRRWRFKGSEVDAWVRPGADRGEGGLG